MYFVGEGDGSPRFTEGSGWVDGCSLLFGWETFVAGVSESVGSSGLFVVASFEWMLLLGDSEGTSDGDSVGCVFELSPLPFWRELPELLLWLYF
ncbi:hypothetical protein NW064_01095 [Mycoplasmopsis felis]|uniref:hypothetical protein n=1 Tax=Mycoplasmopsis felis TaxID=33923 RepID=UPI0021AE7F60|nr:hypothetical protein [Mycoplasmopsis felis]UWW01029.1 hypothetical protein NW064_01095 [Mycoplasmopsis felis]